MRLVQEPPPYLVPHSQEEIVVLYEDADLLLVRKPDLLLSIPGRHPLNKDCLITRLRQRYPTASIVHRLDLDTSGIMVIPLNKPTHAHISRQFQQRGVQKSYHAVVYGVVAQDEGEVDLPIARDWANRPRQMICQERGKAALTRFEVFTARTRSYPPAAQTGNRSLPPVAHPYARAGSPHPGLRYVCPRKSTGHGRAPDAACHQAGLRASHHRGVVAGGKPAGFLTIATADDPQATAGKSTRPACASYSAHFPAL